MVSGNAERRKIIQEKALLFGKKYGQPVLRSNCHVKTVGRKNVYSAPDPHIVEVYDELVKFFVRGAECVLSETLERLGLAKGSTGIILGATWDNFLGIDSLEPGKIHDVPHPKLIRPRDFEL